MAAMMQALKDQMALILYLAPLHLLVAVAAVQTELL
jgi:hypothetical protein